MMTSFTPSELTTILVTQGHFSSGQPLEGYLDRNWGWVVFGLGALVFGYLRAGYLQRKRDQRTGIGAGGGAPPMTEDEEGVVQEFQARRKRANTYGWPAFFLGFACFGLGVQALGSQALSMLGLLVAAAGIITVALNMRCPACNKPPLGRMAGRSGIILNPTACPTCGVRLR